MLRHQLCSLGLLQLGCAGALLEHIASARTRAGDLDAHDVELSGIELLKLFAAFFPAAFACSGLTAP